MELKAFPEKGRESNLVVLGWGSGIGGGRELPER